MDRYKFRGMNHETGEWVKGYYTRLQEGARRFDAIVSEDEEFNLTRYYIHDRESISQYTGLKDVNGVELYEYDFVTLYKGTEWERSFCVGDILAVGFQNNECILMDGDFEIIGNVHVMVDYLTSK